MVIQVEHLSKLYRIGRAHAERRRDTLRDAIVDCGMQIADFARHPLRPAKGVRRSPRALRGDYRNSRRKYEPTAEHP